MSFSKRFTSLLAASVLSVCSLNALSVLFIGDSITDGMWGRSDGTAMPSEKRSLKDMNHIFGHGFMFICAADYMSACPDCGYEFFNRGISGNTLADLEARWDRDVIALEPDVVSVLVGTNDVSLWVEDKNRSAGFDLKGWEERYRRLLDRTLEARKDVRFVLCAPFTANTGRMRKKPDFALRDSVMRECADIVRRIADDYGAVYVPFNTMFDNIYATVPTSDDTYWIWDGIHPTAAGHKRMAELWEQSVNNRGLLY